MTEIPRSDHCISDDCGMSKAHGLMWTILYLLVVVIGLGLRSQALSTVDCTFDECSSWRTINFAWAPMLDSIRRNVHPPIFYVGLKCWAFLFGDGVAALRWFAVVCGLLTLPAAAMFVKMWLSGRENHRSCEITFWTLLVMATNPLHVELCLQARMYSLGILFSLIAAILLLSVLQSGGRAWEWMAFAITINLMMLTHYFCILTAGALGLVLVTSVVIEASRVGFSARNRRLLVGSSACLWVTAIIWRAWLPTFRSQWDQVEADYWIPPITRIELFTTVTKTLTHQSVTLPTSFGVVLLAVVLCVAILVGWNCGIAGRIAAACVLIPWLLVVGKGLSGQSLTVARYLSFAQAFTLLSIVMLAASIASPLWRRMLIVLLLGWNVGWNIDYSTQRSQKARDAVYQPFAELLHDWQDDEVPVVVSSPQTCIVIKRYSEFPENVFVVDHGYAYAHYSGGPLLLESDYIRVENLPETTKELIAIEFAQGQVNVLDDWRPTKTVEFKSETRPNVSLTVRHYVREINQEKVTPQ